MGEHIRIASSAFSLEITGVGARTTMEQKAHRHLLQTMIDYFATGTKESDKAAKAIIDWDFEYLPYWQEEIKRRRDAGEWTGVRAPEADIVVSALQALQQVEGQAG
jgi:hypothetical protein